MQTGSEVCKSGKIQELTGGFTSWTPYQGFVLNPLGALSGPLTLAEIMRILRFALATPLTVITVLKKNLLKLIPYIQKKETDSKQYHRF